MEPNNSIDNQFREKLNSRKIEPSENAWDRLDAMLTVAEKPKRKFGWLYMAASFIGFVLIATVFFSQTEELIDVERPIVNETIEKPSEEETLKEQTILLKTEATVAKADKNSRKPQQTNRTIINQNPTVTQSILVRQNEIVENQQVVHNSQPVLEDQQQKSDYADVEELLAAVKKNKKDKLFQEKAAVKVSSNDLLSQVDGELELTFRQKVIKSVSKNYQEVKVALTTRNQE